MRLFSGDGNGPILLRNHDLLRKAQRGPAYAEKCEDEFHAANRSTPSASRTRRSLTRIFCNFQLSTASKT